MRIERATVLVTGAAGGIGSATALELGRQGARLLLTDLPGDAVTPLLSELHAAGVEAEFVPGNLADRDDRSRLVARAAALRVDTLVNIAGVNPFGLLAEQSAEELERVFLINTTVPVLLCREMLPVLGARDAASIVNVGSAFGSIGFPGFTAYSASKFAIRGFSEALRRELADTNIRVHYLAPRATRTRLVTDRVREMNEALGVAMDPPETVARAVVRALRDNRRELAIGAAERLFSKINALFPALVDRALRKQLPTIVRFASTTAAKNELRRPQSSRLNPLQERPQ
jgi:short-subunit dehydrogenase